MALDKIILKELNSLITNNNDTLSIKKKLEEVLGNKIKKDTDLDKISEETFFNFILKQLGISKEDLEDFSDEDKKEYIEGEISNLEKQLKDKEIEVSKSKTLAQSERNTEARNSLVETIRKKNQIKNKLENIKVAWNILKNINFIKQQIKNVLINKNTTSEIKHQTNIINTSNTSQIKKTSTKTNNPNKKNNEKIDEKENKIFLEDFQNILKKEDKKVIKQFLKEYYINFSDNDKIIICEILLENNYSTDYIESLFKKIKASKLTKSFSEKWMNINDNIEKSKGNTNNFGNLLNEDTFISNKEIVILKKYSNKLISEINISEFVKFYKSISNKNFQNNNGNIFPIKYTYQIRYILKKLFSDKEKTKDFFYELKKNNLFSKHERFFFVSYCPDLDFVLKNSDLDGKSEILELIYRISYNENKYKNKILELLEKLNNIFLKDGINTYTNKKIEFLKKKIEKLSKKLKNKDILFELQKLKDIFGINSSVKEKSQPNQKKLKLKEQKAESTIKTEKKQHEDYKNVNKINKNLENYNKEKKVITIKEEKTAEKSEKVDKKIKEIFDKYMEGSIRGRGAEEKIKMMFSGINTKMLIAIIFKDLNLLFQKKGYYFELLREKVEKYKNNIIELRGREWFDNVICSIEKRINCFELDKKDIESISAEIAKEAFGSSVVAVPIKRDKPKVNKGPTYTKGKVLEGKKAFISKIQTMCKMYLPKYLKGNFIDVTKNAWLIFVKENENKDIFWNILKEQIGDNNNLAKLVKEDFENNGVRFKIDLGENLITIKENLEKNDLESEVSKKSLLDKKIEEVYNIKDLENLIRYYKKELPNMDSHKNKDKYEEYLLSFIKKFDELKYQYVGAIKEKYRIVSYLKTLEKRINKLKGGYNLPENLVKIYKSKNNAENKNNNIVITITTPEEMEKFIEELKKGKYIGEIKLTINSTKLNNNQKL